MALIGTPIVTGFYATYEVSYIFIICDLCGLNQEFVRIAVNDTPVVSATKYYFAIPFDMATLTSTCKDNSEIQLDYY